MKVDDLVYGWVEEKHVCVDLIEVSSFVGVRMRDFIRGQTTLKVASGKVVKHKNMCSDNQHTFIPFVFDIFGFLAPETVNLLQRVQRLIYNNVVSHITTNVGLRGLVLPFK